VLGHSFDKCDKRTRIEEEITQDRSKVWQRKNLGRMKDAKTDKGETSYDKSKKFKEEFPSLNHKKKQVKNNKQQMKNKNKFSVLGGLRDDDQHELNVLKDKILVDKYLNLKLQPSLNETKNWTQDMC
ncbi:hypothetical protein Tco_0170981, partial [Tanacetum coccineum]